MDISVIIVNWNTKKLLEQCLVSVYETINFCNFEVIVVDNASSDGSTEMLVRNFPQVAVIRNKENRGFGAANNQAFAVMKGEYALLLNTDAVLTAGAVQKLWSFAKNNTQTALTCGQLLNADGSKQNSVASFPTLLTLSINISILEYLFPKKYPSKRYEHNKPLKVDSAVGACMLIRKQALDEVSYFDERYFFFFEETDLAYSFKRKGWQIFQIPDAFIYHLQGQSISHGVRSRIEFYRSRYQFLRKWHNRYYYWAAFAIILFRLVADFLLNFVAVIATVGLVETVRKKTTIYLQLIFWNIKYIIQNG